MGRLRPSSPGQLAVIGLGLCVLGLLVGALHVLTLAGIALVVFAGVSYLMRPRRSERYWRGRRIDLDGPPSAAARLYRLIYRR